MTNDSGSGGSVEADVEAVKGARRFIIDADLDPQTRRHLLDQFDQALTNLTDRIGEAEKDRDDYKAMAYIEQDLNKEAQARIAELEASPEVVHAACSDLDRIKSDLIHYLEGRVGERLAEAHLDGSVVYSGALVRHEITGDERDATFPGVGTVRVRSLPPTAECLLCGHVLPLAVWREGTKVGVCTACRDLALSNRGPCSSERGCSCAALTPPMKGMEDE